MISRRISAPRWRRRKEWQGSSRADGGTDYRRWPLVSLDKRMIAKPILFWPKARSDIERYFDREEADFLVVDTNCFYDLQRLYKLQRENLILDPFPHYGEHYRDFSDHVVASDCRCHVVGLEACRDVLRVLKDPSLARSPIEELLTAMALPCSTSAAPLMTKRGMKIPIDWSNLNWANTSFAAMLVFVAALIGNILSVNNGLLAAIVATALFAALYVCVRANFADLFFTNATRSKPHAAPAVWTAYSRVVSILRRRRRA
jgi:hypothetical protein